MTIKGMNADIPNIINTANKMYKADSELLNLFLNIIFTYFFEKFWNIDK
ncbi:Uncharacterized protein dnm_062020 [Desulfonema magnum]|uniref:Uncharacterized protein n=1 Tax=Desulfonema magnum TaxID=45655 RepID=A0A975BR68_9BACT|nr:Uncharacterized protein dnm_062020 [Desulfonema magnum]